MHGLQIIEIEGVRVLSTKQIAEAYGVTKDKIIYNFNYNKKRFILGKHYIEVSGDELRELKRTYENQISFKYAKSLYLWTEKGALLHAKSLNTDKAWEVYDWLVDFYFRVKEKSNAPATPTEQKTMEKAKEELLLDIPNNREVQEKIQRIKKHCMSMSCVLDLYNRYINAEDAKGLIKSIDAIGAEICLDAFELKKLKINNKVKVW